MVSLRRLLVASAIVAAVGCTPPRYKVRITTTPTPADVTVSSAEEDNYVLRTPTAHVFEFAPEGKSYNLTFSAEGYDTYVRSLTKGQLEVLPKTEESDTRALHVTLTKTKKPFEELDEIVIVFDPATHKYVGRRKVVRSYEEDVERTTGPVARIVDLGATLRIGGLALSPDGERLVYALAEVSRSDANNCPIASANLHLVSNKGGGIAPITDDQHVNLFPMFDVGGDKVFFVSDCFGGSTLVRKSAKERSGGLERVYEDTRAGQISEPSVSPTGLLVFDVVGQGAPRVKARLWSLGGPAQYPQQIGEGHQARVSPDGTRIVYIGPDHNIWSMKTDGGERTQLTSKALDMLNEAAKKAPSWDMNTLAEVYPPYSNPCWSPDGRYILYTSREGRDNSGEPNEDIWMMTSEGTNPTQLTTNGSTDQRPDVSPDGRFIYFVSNRGGSWAICRMEAPAILKPAR